MLSKRNLFILIVVAAAIFMIAGIFNFINSSITNKEKPAEEFKTEAKINVSISPHKNFKIEWTYNTGVFSLVDIERKTTKTIKQSNKDYNIESVIWSPDERHFAVNYSNGCWYFFSSLYTISGEAVKEYAQEPEYLPEWDYGGAPWHMGKGAIGWIDNDSVSWESWRYAPYMEGYTSIGAGSNTCYIYSLKNRKSTLVSYEEYISIGKDLASEAIKQLSKYVAGLNKKASFRKRDRDGYVIITKDPISQKEANRIIEILGGRITKHIYDDGDVTYEINDFDEWIRSAKEARTKGDAKGFLRCADYIVKGRSMSAESYVQRGDAYVMNGDKTKAYEDYQKAIKLDPSNRDALNRLSGNENGKK